MAEQTAKIIIAAEDRAAPALASVQNALRGLTTQAGALAPSLGALGASLSVGSLLAFVKNTNDGVDALNDLKDATGASIENISALEDVAARTGTAFDTVGTSLIKFNQILNEAKPDSDAAAALKAIGLEAEALRRLDPAEALRVTAVALGKFADDGNKARITQELFGKSLREVAPFLNDLKEQGALVAKVTAEQAEEAEKFNKQLFELQKNATDAGRALTADLVTGINLAAKAYRESGLLSGIQTFLTGDDQYKNNKALVEDTEKLLRLENDLVRFKEQGYKDGSRVIENIKAQIAQTKQAIDTTMVYRKVLAETNAVASGGADKPSAGALPAKAKKSGAEQIDEQRTSLAAYVKQLNEQLYTVNKISESQQALNFLAAQGAQGQIPQVRELVLGLAERVDQEKKIADVMREQNRLQKESDEAYKSRLQRMLDSGPEAQLEKLRQDMLLLADEYEEGNITEQQFKDAATGMLNLKKATDESTRSASEFGFVFNSALEDAILNSKDAMDVLQALGQDIARVFIRQQITEPLATGAGKFFAGFDWGDLFSFDGGGSTGSGSRSGGLDGKGGFLALMHPQETVIDHTRVGYGSSQPIVQNFNFNGPADRAQVITAAQLGAAMAREQARDDRARGRA